MVNAVLEAEHKVLKDGQVINEGNGKIKRILHPATFFFVLTILVILVSHMFRDTTVTYFDARTGAEKIVTSISLLSSQGVKYIFTNAVSSFVNFAPLGTMIIAILGVGIADGSGLIMASLKKLVVITPPRLVTFFVIFISILSNLANDAGYVILLPLAATIFLCFGRHPLAGMAASFAGIAGGYAANLFTTQLDATLTAITNTALKSSTIDFTVSDTANYYFLVVSVLLLTFIGALITEKVIEPRLGAYHGKVEVNTMKLLPNEKKGLIYAGITFLVLLALILYMTLPTNAILLGEDKTLNEFIYSGGLVFCISLMILIPGLVYGLISGSIKSDRDVVRMMSQPVGQLSSFLIILFFAAQFISLFEYSKIGTVLIVNLANQFKNTAFDGYSLLFMFIGLVAVLNIFVGSASMKWSILAPIFIPMLYRLGVSPVITQLAFRVGDSATNMITPLLPYFIVLVIYTQKYQVDGEKPLSVGKLISIMLPYSLAFFGSWLALLGFWFFFGIPFGM